MNWRAAELVLRAAGILLLAACGYKIALYSAFQARPELFLKLRDGSAPGSMLAGKLEIPRLHLRVSIVEGDDEESLSLGAGHVRGTADFGEAGNAVIAGHRDAAFGALRNIRIGDDILIHSGRESEYLVTKIRTVAPDDLSVLRNDDTSKLTLITCYPFSYLGPAPKRYIVEARLVPVVPANNKS
jgi:sortase A